jgi:ferritin-like metal-binding protein YciE
MEVAEVSQQAVERDEDTAGRLQRLYLEQMTAIRAAERDARSMLPPMAAAAVDEDVTAVLRDAASETEIQIARLDGLVEALDLDIDEASSCLEDLLSGVTSVLKGGAEKPDDLDTFLLRSARQALRHQISGYESACATARRLGDFQTLDILLLSLDEELATDSALSELVSRRSRLLRAI